ncbi:CmpA/NrtA family ABC transporter substrate-binding protein [Rheinheimera riviphila]|nr:CmpA/NrtA family ABC transporter substrate-binding protein [Rheinheimera riviphila]
MNFSSQNSQVAQPKQGGLEKPQLKLGFIQLLDSAPLIIALEQGLFEAEGLSVQLQREVSWATLRDKVAYGLLDGAQMLAPMPLAATLGLGAPAVAMTSAMVLSRGGNAITLSTRLLTQLGIDQQTPTSQVPAALHNYVAANQRPLTFATVYPYSCHHYQLHAWLEHCGIAPSAIQVIGIAPAMATAALQQGVIDGFCVGEPWNSLAEAAGHGRIVLSMAQPLTNLPAPALLPQYGPAEKVFGITTQFKQQHPHTCAALIRALQQAAHWLVQQQYQPGLSQLLAQAEYLDLPAALLATLLTPERPSLFSTQIPIQFCTEQSQSLADARWVARQMLQLGQLSQPVTDQLLAQVYLP